MSERPFENASRFFRAVLLFVVFSAIIAVSNYFAALSGGDEESVYMMVSGILFGFLGIPLFMIILPLWLSKRWNLPRWWWPQKGNRSLSVAIMVLYFVVGNFVSAQQLMQQNFDVIRFIIHFISSMLFHVPYYPLFAILIFTSARA